MLPQHRREIRRAIEYYDLRGWDWTLVVCYLLTEFGADLDR